MKLNDARHCAQHAHNGGRGVAPPRPATPGLSVRCVRCASVGLGAPAGGVAAGATYGRSAQSPAAPASGTPTTRSPRANRPGASRAGQPRAGVPVPEPAGPGVIDLVGRRSKHKNVVSPMASQRSFLALRGPSRQKKFVDKLWVMTALGTQIPFVKRPRCATVHTNSPGERVATGCKLVASWAKLVIGKGGHR
jgi:hypothetical protein